jgi:ATP-binding cassette subfamily F protein 3
VRGDFTNEDVTRQYLARFRFWGDDPLRSVGGFSGGERSRLALAKLLLEPRNLLFLDEPTNHLDIPAAEILEEALAGFEGTVVLVSHDRRFLENVTTRIVAVRDGHVDVFPGTFKEYATHTAARARAEEEPREAPPKKAAPPKKVEAPTKAPKPAEKNPGFEAQKQASRDREKKKRRVKELEDLIAGGEKKLEELRAVLREDPGGDWAKLAERANEEQALARRIEQMMNEWTRLSEGET